MLLQQAVTASKSGYVGIQRKDRTIVYDGKTEFYFSIRFNEEEKTFKVNRIQPIRETNKWDIPNNEYLIRAIEDWKARVYSTREKELLTTTFRLFGDALQYIEPDNPGLIPLLEQATKLARIIQGVK